ncbi:MAG: hypothetical protein GWP05_00365 [Anaerolineaceae bacterium]|nr:hypothetical protein [Anaerolineaceae bacterium]
MDRSLADRRWDLISAGILLLPLVLMAFQGDLLFALVERMDEGGQYARIRTLEIELQQHEDEIKKTQLSWLTAKRLTWLRDRTSRLELEIKSLRDPLDRTAESWNFSFVTHWPLLLLLGPLALALLWYRLSAAERRRLYGDALDSGARMRGILLALLAVGLFWVAAWQKSVLDRQVLANLGDMDWRPDWWREWIFIAIYGSMLAWTAASVYAFTGRGGLKRIWLPGAVAMALLILNFGPLSRRWVSLWDAQAQWSYCYMVGPIAAMLFYFLLIEKNSAKLPAATDTRPQGSSKVRPARQDVLLTPASVQDLPATDDGRQGSRWLLTWGAVAAVLGLAGMAGSGAADRLLGSSQLGEALRLALHFAYLPFVLGVLLLALGLWQRVEKGRHGDLALRLAGLVLILLAVALRMDAGGGAVKVHYFADLTIIPMLFGIVLALGGWSMLRVAWVSLAFLILAIPWPERYYLAIAARPQEWAAIMTEKFMHLCGYDMLREGTRMIINPATGDSLTVAEQCSGLRILLAFVALSVVYAYINKRPIWRRAIIFVSAFPIAVFCNFTRVALMALVYKWGYKDIAMKGMQHEMAGFAMLPLAFFLLWVEMRFLDAMKKLLDWATAVPPAKEDSAAEVAGGDGG